MDGTLTSLQSHCSIQHAALQPAELMLQHGDSKDEALKTFYTYANMHGKVYGVVDRRPVSIVNYMK